MAIPFAAIAGLGGMGGMGAGAGGAAEGGGGLSGLLAGMGRFGAPGTPGAVGGTPMAGGAMPGGAQGGGFWQQFQSMYGGGAPGGAPTTGGAAPSNPFTAKLGKMGMPGVETATAYLDNLENRVGRLSEMYRGPTMPFRPHLNTSQVGPNMNPGQMGLSQLLASIATRRG